MTARRAAFALALLLAAGCGRRDARRAGTAAPAAPADSFTVLAEDALAQWDQGEPDHAAKLTAQAIFEALRRRPEGPWTARARGLVDSLGFVADVAGSDQLALVNVRSRLNPDADTWPWLLWREADGAHEQSVEGSGLQLARVATRGFDGGFATDTSQVAAVWTQRGPVGDQPLLMVWRHGKGARWDLQQTIGNDTLGGTGDATFEPGPAGPVLATRTFQPTEGFNECPDCPHVHRDRRFAWTAAGFRKTDDRLVPTSYTTFTEFIRAMQAHDVLRAEKLVVDPMLLEFARRFAWDDESRGPWRTEPGTSDAMPEMVFFRGSSEAYRVAFEARENDWRISGFEPVLRTID